MSCAFGYRNIQFPKTTVWVCLLRIITDTVQYIHLPSFQYSFEGFFFLISHEALFERELRQFSVRDFLFVLGISPPPICINRFLWVHFPRLTGRKVNHESAVIRGHYQRTDKDGHLEFTLRNGQASAAKEKYPSRPMKRQKPTSTNRPSVLIQHSCSNRWQNC